LENKIRFDNSQVDYVLIVDMLTGDYIYCVWTSYLYNLNDSNEAF